MKNFVKLSVLLPILIGVIAGITLFLLGDADDSPGLSLMGLIAAFALIIWGIYNAGVIKPGFLAPIVLLLIGAGGILFSIMLWLDGEFGQTPGIALAGVALGAALLCAGMVMLFRRFPKR